MTAPQRDILKTLAAVLSLILAFGFAGGCDKADAVTPPPQGWGNAYQQAAYEYWGERPTACASTYVEWDSTVPATHGTVSNGTPVLGYATLATQMGIRCTMYVAPLDGMGLFFRCVLYAHEYGHWLGWPDNASDPYNAVVAEVLGPYTIDQPCAELVERAYTGRWG